MPVYESLDPEVQERVTAFVTLQDETHMRNIRRYIIETQLKRIDERFRKKCEESELYSGRKALLKLLIFRNG